LVSFGGNFFSKIGYRVVNVDNFFSPMATPASPSFFGAALAVVFGRFG
jgi:hypothetical protein